MIDQELHRFVMNHLYSAKQNLLRFPASSLAVAINATLLVCSMMDETASLIIQRNKVALHTRPCVEMFEKPYTRSYWLLWFTQETTACAVRINPSNKLISLVNYDYVNFSHRLSLLTL